MLDETLLLSRGCQSNTIEFQSRSNRSYSIKLNWNNRSNRSNSIEVIDETIELINQTIKVIDQRIIQSWKKCESLIGFDWLWSSDKSLQLTLIGLDWCTNHFDWFYQQSFQLIGPIISIDFNLKSPRKMKGF